MNSLICNDQLRGYEASLTIIQDPHRELYIAKQSEQIAGFIILVMQGAFTGYIQSICVAPAMRGHKIGSQLMTFAEERIFRETPNIFICVSSFNKDALRLYKRLGFDVVGELANYIVEGHSEILMRKTIGAKATFQPQS